MKVLPFINCFIHSLLSNSTLVNICLYYLYTQFRKRRLKYISWNLNPDNINCKAKPKRVKIMWICRFTCSSTLKIKLKALESLDTSNWPLRIFLRFLSIIFNWFVSNIFFYRLDHQFSFPRGQIENKKNPNPFFCHWFGFFRSFVYSLKSEPWKKFLSNNLVIICGIWFCNHKISKSQKKIKSARWYTP